MPTFSIDPDQLRAGCEGAAKRAASGEGPKLLERLRRGDALQDTDLAALYCSEDVATNALLEVATGLRSNTSPRIETFSPLYMSNLCDAECVMCGMRRMNDDLQRETADAETTRSQLDILHRRGIRGVALLTGEYRRGSLRTRMIERTAVATRDALDRGYSHILINIGSIDADEFADLLAGIPRTQDGAVAPQVTMCTFQETYDPGIYARFMGTNPENPRSDFQRRIENFDRAARAGMRFANPGILLGLNRDVTYELMALSSHIRHLISLELTVYISLPRLRKASGAEHRAGVSDDELTRVVSILSAGFPAAKVVISTREKPEIQHRLLPVIGVLTAGSPGVAPYTESSARFDIEASQFEVADQRPFEEILGECLAAGATIEGYEPGHAHAAG